MWNFVVEDKLLVISYQLLLLGTRYLQQTYSAREIGEMQELEKHNLTRITNAPADFLIH